MKNNVIDIDKDLLCATDIKNCEGYENFAMQILNKSANGKMFAITSDCNKYFARDIVCLNVCHNLANLNKKVLLVDFDVYSCAIANVIGEDKSNEKVLSFDNFDVILAKSNDYFTSFNEEELVKKYAQYDIVIINLPSPKKNSAYLTVPNGVNAFVLATKYFSTYYAVNKCISKLKEVNVNVQGSVFIKLK